jgi:hypothetical protein
VVGYLAIRFLLSYLARHSLRPFAYYRFALAAIVATILLSPVRDAKYKGSQIGPILEEPHGYGWSTG